MSRFSSRRLVERTDLSVPRGSAGMGARYDADAFGRFSEAIARFLGTGRFLAGQTVIVIGWIALNTLGLVKHWDPYPFILLNLAFSTQAAYAAPLILLAQNRQDDRDRASIERDREVAARTQADTEFLARELAAVRLALADVVEEMEPDDAADLLAEMPAEQRERLLTAMEATPAADLRRLLGYDAATAGGLMTSQPLIVTPDTPVAEVLARIRNPDLPVSSAVQVYVCEPPMTTPTGRYLGSVGFQRLLRRPPATKAGECVEASVFVRPDLPKRELAARLAAYNMISVAVCDEDGRLLGAVTVDVVLAHLLPADWRRAGG